MIKNFTTEFMEEYGNGRGKKPRSYTEEERERKRECINIHFILLGKILYE